MRRSHAAVAFAASFLCLASSVEVFAQQMRRQPDMPVNAETRAKVIEIMLERLNDAYVYPEVAKKMEASIRERVSKGAYDSIESSQAFAEKLTEDLQAVSKDKHLRVRYSHEPTPAHPDRGEPSAEERDRRRHELAWMNHGFEKAERLPGNIGYIQFRGFYNDEWGAETVASAMSFIANTDALIIDLRQNGGGTPGMVTLLSSYLLGPEPVHLNSLYWREGDRTEEFWTRREISGKRYLGKDVYILTSKRTFSAAEEFTYNLKNLKRATIVGETTGGGAHPGGGFRINEHFHMFIPMGRAINPITKTNWESVGVEPDINVPADLALKTAHLAALKKNVANFKEPQMKAGVEHFIAELEKELSEAQTKKDD